MPQNTSPEQDRQVKAAQSSDHLLNLLDIIEDLDGQLTEWKAAADAGSGCDTPEGLRSFINSLS